MEHLSLLSPESYKKVAKFLIVRTERQQTPFIIMFPLF